MDGWNYFNYFTEIEEYFWKKRGRATCWCRPLDWGDHGNVATERACRLEAVLKGDRSRVLKVMGVSRRGRGKNR